MKRLNKNHEIPSQNDTIDISNSLVMGSETSRRERLSKSISIIKQNPIRVMPTFLAEFILICMISFALFMIFYPVSIIYSFPTSIFSSFVLGLIIAPIILPPVSTLHSIYKRVHSNGYKNYLIIGDDSVMLLESDVGTFRGDDYPMTESFEIDKDIENIRNIEVEGDRIVISSDSEEIVVNENAQDVQKALLEL